MTKIIAVTACPSGVAHTYMAAEALESAAKAKGWEVKVEAQGSIGLENERLGNFCDIKHCHQPHL